MGIPFVQTIIDDIVTRTEILLRRSSIYDWSLSSNKIERFIVELSDHWPGDSGRGRWLCNDTFDCYGVLWQKQGHSWSDKDLTPAQIEFIHGFSWLRDLKTVGGDMGRRKSRELIHDWIKHHSKWDKQLWRQDILSVRLSNWIKLYAFFGASADDHFQEVFFNSLCKQYKHLCNTHTEDFTCLVDLQSLAALIYGALSLKGQEIQLERFLKTLEAGLRKLILDDGGFITRSPKDLLEAVKIILDLKLALQEADYPTPPFIEHSLDRTIPALRFFRTEDGKMALFHDMQEEDEPVISMIMKRAGMRGKTWKSLPTSGYEHMERGKTSILIDAGTPSSSGYTKHISASPLAFNMMDGKERVLVNCGTHPIDQNWEYALRCTPAHNTLTIDNRNAFEILEHGSIGRRNTVTQWSRSDEKGHCFVVMDHDGYVPLNGLKHIRQLYLNETGTDFRGEDILESALEGVQQIEAHPFDIRFHLHPTIMVSLIKNGTEALLKTKQGKGWRFIASDNMRLSLENSIYFSRGAVMRKTKQLVLNGYAQGERTVTKWSFKRM